MPSGYEGGRREKLADFVGFTSTNSSKTRRPDALTFDYLTAFCPGPVANANTTEGVVSYAWRCRVENPSAFDFTGRVYISRENDTGDGWGDETELFTFTGSRIVEVDIAFEQAGRPVVCAERDTGVDGAPEVWLYWFDSTDSTFGFDNFGAGKTPRVIIDAPFNITDSDVLLFYLTSTNLVYRQQRDRYAVEANTPYIVDDTYYIEDVVKLRDSRIRVDMSHRNVTTGKYTHETITSTLYPISVGPDSVEPSMEFASGELVIVIIEDTLNDVDELDPSFAFISGLLAEPTIIADLYDRDSFDHSFAFVSGTLADTTILKTLYDIDSFDPSFVLVSGTLITIVIAHTVFDVSQLDTSFAFISGTLETV